MDFVLEEITEIGDKEILKHRKQILDDIETYSKLAINVPAKREPCCSKSQFLSYIREIF